jgi:ribonucleoside-diphosphate reductase alpha chain
MVNVRKHSGNLEPLDISKGTASLEWAIGDLKGVSASEIEIQSKLHLYDGIETSYITDIYIKTCDDMADLRNINYDAVARNLKIQKLYKKVFGSIVPTNLVGFLTERVEDGHYSNNLLHNARIDYDVLNDHIDHSSDFTFTSSGLDALIKGYGVCDMETPQFMFMAIAIDIFRDYHLDPMPYVIGFYHGLRTFKITLPSPEMRALRTNSTDYASCITFRMGDSIDSWKQASNALIDHTVASAGVGIDISDVASLGDKVKNGKITHSGKIPVLKSIDADIQKASQNGRRGSATGYINFFDTEIETIFALKSPRMPVEDRINDLSYGIKLTQLAYDRATEGGVISLFSVRNTPGELFEAFHSGDNAWFKRVYEQCEQDELYSSQIDAQFFWERMVAIESTETSSYYILNIDEVNQNSHITRPIHNYNICMEYGTGTETLSSKHPDRPDIGVCVLGNVNQGKVAIEELPAIMDLLVRAQSHIMIRQIHPTSQANAYVNMYHDIGLGLSNHAFWLADNDLRYGTEDALYRHNEWMEHFSFNAHVASMHLAEELGAAKGFEYHAKLLPIDRYNKNCDELVSPELHCNWEWLKSRVLLVGMYNVGLMMVPPAETSAGPSNQITSLEPLRSLLTIKDKSGTNYKQFAPDALRLANKYDFAFDKDMNIPFIKDVAITQKWVDKGISANTFYNPEWEGGKISAKDVIMHLFLMKYYGCKGRYYQNTKLPDEVDALAESCTGGGCSV